MSTRRRRSRRRSGPASGGRAATGGSRTVRTQRRRRLALRERAVRSSRATNEREQGFLGQPILRDEAERAGMRRPPPEIGGVAAGHEHDGGGAAGQGIGHVEPAHVRKRDVQEDELWLELLRERESGPAVTGLA